MSTMPAADLPFFDFGTPMDNSPSLDAAYDDNEAALHALAHVAGEVTTFLGPHWDRAAVLVVPIIDGGDIDAFMAGWARNGDDVQPFPVRLSTGSCLNRFAAAFASKSIVNGEVDTTRALTVVISIKRQDATTPVPSGTGEIFVFGSDYATVHDHEFATAVLDFTTNNPTEEN